MEKRLGDFVDIIGSPHPPINREVQGGDISWIKSKNINELGFVDDSNLTKVTLLFEEKVQWIQTSDLLFKSECHRREHFTASVNNVTGRIVTSSNLYILRLKKNLEDTITRDFICWQLNQKPIQTYLRNVYRGPRMPRISSRDLAYTPFNIIPLDKQKQLLRLYQTSLQEKNVLENIIKNRAQKIEAIGLRVLNE